MEKQVKKHSKYGSAFGLGISSVSILGVGIILAILGVLDLNGIIDFETTIPNILAGGFAFIGVILFLVEGILLLKKEDFGKLKAKVAGIVLICASGAAIVCCLPFALDLIGFVDKPNEILFYISIGVTVLFALFLLVFGIVVVVFMAKKNKKS